MMKKINEFIEKNIILIFTIFLFMHPILDVITGIMLYYNDITFTFSSIIRILFLIFIIYYLLFIGDKKNRKYIYILFIYSILFIVTNIFFKVNCSIVLEIKNLFNNIYFPILLIFLFDLLKNKTINEKNIYLILMTYLLLVFIPNILNIGFNSYWHSKTGSVGFFYSANAIGNIISIISPLLIAYLVLNKNKIKLLIFLIIYFYVLLTLGTKAPLLCTSIILFYYLILYIIKLLKNKNYLKIGMSLLCILIFIVCLVKIMPKTPFYKNLIIHLNYLKIEKFTDLLTYKNIDHFIFSSRLKFFKNEFKVYQNSNIMQKLFGIGYYDNGKLMKIAEMDYLDTVIHQGIIGFILIYIKYFEYLFIIFKNYIKNFKKNFFDIRKTSMFLLIIISILCSFLTGHVLATPTVSVFVAVLIVISYNNICERDKKYEKIQKKTVKKN